jgi:hypothetical protein
MEDGKMPIRDRSIGWKTCRQWIPIREFAGWDNNGTADITLSAGTATLEPITTSEIAGLPMDAADEICHVMAIPWNINRNKKVLGRIFFQHAAAGADTPIFKWTSKFFGKQDQLTEFIAGADVSTTFAAHTCSTTNPSLEVTVWTDLSWDSYISATDILYAMSIELDSLGSASTDECKVIGVELMWEIEATGEYRQRSSLQVAANPV